MILIFIVRFYYPVYTPPPPPPPINYSVSVIQHALEQASNHDSSDRRPHWAPDRCFACRDAKLSFQILSSVSELRRSRHGCAMAHASRIIFLVTANTYRSYPGDVGLSCLSDIHENLRMLKFAVKLRAVPHRSTKRATQSLAILAMKCKVSPVWA
eukprot:SAG31_NODE_8668_length_1410_cov_1.458429_3_plen_155_part_00